MSANRFHASALRLVGLVACMGPVVLAAGTSACVDDGAEGCPPIAAPLPPPASAAPLRAPVDGPRTLIVYDTGGAWGALGELYAAQVANLVSHFGRWTARPAAAYTRGELAAHDALVYVGSTYDEPLPDAFLDDVAAGERPVLWLYQNVWKLDAGAPGFAARLGWRLDGYDHAAVAQVRYKGESLPRDTRADNGPLAALAVSSPAAVEVLATAVRADGQTLPWAVRSGRFTYVAEIPFRYADDHDRQVIVADLLFDLLAPTTPERHRALVRIENVGPDADPDALRAIADYLSQRGVPFSFAFYPRYVDPLGLFARGPELCLQQRPALAEAVRYLLQKGGTMVLYGLTHQLGARKNPFSAASGDDYEFFTAAVDARNEVVLTGPVDGDSEEWASHRLGAALGEVQAMQLPRPSLFAFPRYAASPAAYRAAGRYFAARYERGLYFGGALGGGTVDFRLHTAQSFPFAVTDLYGARVIPENLGGYSPYAWFNEPPRLVADLLAAARGHRVVRDGVASFYHQWYAPLPVLAALIEGIQALGYTFVSPDAVAGLPPVASP